MGLFEFSPRQRSVGILNFQWKVFALVLLAPLSAAAQQYGPTFVAQAPETLPPPATAAPAERDVPDACQPVPGDTPLVALSVDVRPRDIEGNIVTADRLPTDCATHLFPEERFVNIDTHCCQMNVCDLLQLAAYCHNPLYFEERLLERYGKRTCCCQPLQSAACFYGNALCLPAKMWRNCPCSCLPAHPCD